MATGTLLFVGLLISLTANNVIHAKFIFTMPRYLRAGTREQFCVELTEHEDDVVFNITISPQKANKHAPLNKTTVQRYIFVSGDGKCDHMQVPQETGKYTVEVTHGSSGSKHESHENVTHTVDVTVAGGAFLTFIQTDKPMYKPGQTVRFRVMTVMRDLRPRSGSYRSIVIKDPNDVSIQQWKDVSSEDGLVSLSIPMSSEPVQGMWKIVVRFDSTKEVQTFKVEEYVLPKYEVKITTPKFLLPTTETIDFKICAKYTYGKSVEGTIETKVCIKGYSYYWRRRDERPCVSFIERINGCKTFSVNSTLVYLSARRFYLYGNSLKISANVTEEGTGVVLSGESSGPQVTFEGVKIKLKDESSGHYKPGFPYRGQAIVTKPDGSPAPNEVIRINAIDFKNDVRLTRTFTTDDAGIINFAINSNDLSEKTTYFSVEAIGVFYGENQYSPDYHTLLQPRTSQQIRRWYSRSDSYMQIEKLKGSPKCGDVLEFNVLYTTPPSTYYKFFYSILSRNRIVEAGHKKHHFKIHDAIEFVEIDHEEVLKEEITTTTVPNTPPLPTNQTIIKHIPPPVVPELFNEEKTNISDRRRRSAEEKDYVISTHVARVPIKFTISPEMSPKPRLLVYYIREDGEVIADNLEFTIPSCFANDVTMEFEKDEVMPGEATKINLKASPKSLCSIGVVDKSVQLHGGDNQLTPDKVFEKLQQYESRAYPYYNWFYGDNRRYCQEQLEKKEGKKRPEDYYGYRYISDYVDASKAFQRTGLVVLTDLDFETRPCYKDRMIYYYGLEFEGIPVGMPGPRTETQSGLAPDTPDSVQPEEQLQVDELSSEPQLDLRHIFPETWLWDIKSIGENGTLELIEDMPHTITEWVGNAVCTNKKDGVGVSPLTSVKAFQPFFLSYTLPYSAVRGEKLPILVTIFNYLEDCLTLEVGIALSDDFDLDSNNSPLNVLCVCGGDSHTLKFYITPKSLGSINITALALSLANDGTCDGKPVSESYLGLRDAVVRPLLIEAEGIEKEYTISNYVCAEEESLNTIGDAESKNTIRLELPDEIIPDSARGFFSVIGDVMGPALNNLEQLLRMPTGCGEQNMVGFAPDISILKYLEISGQSNPALEAKAKEFLRIGYQRQLTYMHKDYSFSAFGDKYGKNNGSIWLTAFVVRSFAQAADYIYIDREQVDKSIDFIFEQQMQDGCFQQVGAVHSKYLKGGLSGLEDKKGHEAGLAAYILASLLEAGVSRTDSRILKGFLCLNSKKPYDIYTLSQTAYAYTLLDKDHPDRINVMGELMQKAIKKDGLMHLQVEDTKPTPSPQRWRWYQAPSAEIEMTAYALLSVLVGGQEDGLIQGRPFVLWLSKQRSGLGGFRSTQDTVLGLQALSEFAAAAYTGSSNISISASGKEFKHSYSINKDNTLILQQNDVSVIPNDIQLSVDGVGCLMIQATVRYNIPNKETGPAFESTVNVHRAQNHEGDCARRTISVCSRYLRADGVSNMAIVEVKMVTGWIPVKSTLRSLVENDQFDLQKYEVEKNYVAFYFEQLDKLGRCFYFDVEQTMEVEDVKPAYVKVYDYYENELEDIEEYEIQKTCGLNLTVPIRYPPICDIGFFARSAVITRDFNKTLGNETMVSVNKTAESTNTSSSKKEEGQPGPAVEIKPEVSCPRCLSKPPEILDDYKQIICNSTSVFKATSNRKGKFSMKIKADLARKKKRRMNIFVHVDKADECVCKPMGDGTTKDHKVLIFGPTSSVNGTAKTIYLNNQNTVIKYLRETEKTAFRTLRKVCWKKEKKQKRVKKPKKPRKPKNKKSKKKKKINP